MFDKFKNAEDLYDTLSINGKEKKNLEVSKERLAVKKYLTIYNKNKFEDITEQKKNYVTCLKSCYDKFDTNNVDSETPNILASCKHQCKGITRDLYNFFDNINFLSEEKIKNCSKQCEVLREKSPNSENLKNEEFFDCNWVCYNKLDRRYREYWKMQRDQIVNRHSYQNLG